MRSRHAAFSVFALAAIGITLGLKALVSDFRVTPDFPRFTALLNAVLERQGFAVTRIGRRFDQTFLVARRDTCVMALRGENRGDYGDGFRRQTRSFGPFAYSYAFRGEYRSTFPDVSFQAGEYVDRVLTRLGFPRPTRLPIAVGATAACPLDRIDLGPALIYPTG